MRNTRLTCAAMHKTSVLPMSIWAKVVRKAKFQANIEAIKLLKYLEETTEQATPEQQKILSRYVGLGAALPMPLTPTRKAGARNMPS